MLLWQQHSVRLTPKPSIGLTIIPGEFPRMSYLCKSPNRNEEGHDDQEDRGCYCQIVARCSRIGVIW